MRIKKMAVAAVVGAAYAALTLLTPLSFFNVEFRVSEALCVLPFICPQSAWGLFVGCVISNMFYGMGPIDVVIGSLATLIAGLMTARIRRTWLAPLPAVLVNAVMIGGMLVYVLESPPALFWAYAGGVALSQFGACYVLGLPLLLALLRVKFFRDMQHTLREDLNA